VRIRSLPERGDGLGDHLANLSLGQTGHDLDGEITVSEIPMEELAWVLGPEE